MDATVATTSGMQHSIRSADNYAALNVHLPLPPPFTLHPRSRQPPLGPATRGGRI